ncbi:MAG: SDR family oxidoreductase [Dehalococcoidales bacterium]|nr:SDR family oxidoreductase [Dehalococcoidales bacterium]
MIPKEFSLSGKVAVVGGAGRSWLKELASYLAEAGADVVLYGQDDQEMAAAAQAVKKMGRRAMTITTNVTSSREVEKMVATAVAQFGQIDILVNSFDRQFAKPLVEVTVDEWNRVMATNLNAVFVGTKAVGKHMLERKEGKIITISSGLAERGLPNSTAYCTSKGGVIQFTRALALEWARQNVRVNAIALGWMAEGAEAQEGDWRNLLTRYIPVMRLGQPDDLAAVLVYLASDASSFVTGSTFYVTGGLMAHG